MRWVRPNSINRSIERIILRGVGPWAALSSIVHSGRASMSSILRTCLILRPVRLSRLELLPMIGAFSIAQGVRKATGVVATIRAPGEVVIEGLTVGNAFSQVEKRGSGSGACCVVVLDLRVACTIVSNQLGDLLENSPWPSNTLFLEPEILAGKILESFDWIYSEWERGMDRTLEGRIRPISADFLP